MKVNPTINPTIKELAIGPEVLILAIKASLPFECVLYIHHPVRFKKDEAKIQALLDSGNEVNAMTLAYMAELGRKVQPINIKV